MFSSKNLKALIVRPSRQVVIASALCLLELLGFCCINIYNNWIWIALEIGCIACTIIFCTKSYRFPLALLACLLIFLIANEIYLRLHYLGLGITALDISKINTSERGHPLFSCQYGPSATGVKADSVFYLQGHRYDINKDGFRGPNYSYEKPANTFRVAVLDACCGEAMAVDYEKGFVSLLESSFNKEKLGRKFEFLNFSLAGNQYSNMLYLLKNLVPRYKPDLILMHMMPYWGTAKEIQEFKYKKAPASWVDIIGQPKYRFFGSIFFVSFALSKIHGPITIWLSQQLGSTSKSSAASPEMWIDRWNWTLKTAKDLSDSTPLVIYMLRPLAEPPGKDLHQWQRREITKIAKSLDIKVIDTYDVASVKPAEMLIYPGESHFNSTGHALFAKRIQKDLLPIISTIIEKQNTQMKEQCPGAD
ncbi:MAG: hypothetical protein K2X27_05005 [Candidatus Obscuribacterales bacterium]|nr:hypothetical protein [Candidatus Obscuribacterales bacterium]